MRRDGKATGPTSAQVDQLNREAALHSPEQAALQNGKLWLTLVPTLVIIKITQLKHSVCLQRIAGAKVRFVFHKFDEASKERFTSGMDNTQISEHAPGLSVSERQTYASDGYQMFIVSSVLKRRKDFRKSVPHAYTFPIPLRFSASAYRK